MESFEDGVAVSSEEETGRLRRTCITSGADASTVPRPCNVSEAAFHSLGARAPLPEACVILVSFLDGSEAPPTTLQKAYSPHFPD